MGSAEGAGQCPCVLTKYKATLIYIFYSKCCFLFRELDTVLCNAPAPVLLLLCKTNLLISPTIATLQCLEARRD